MIYVVLFMKFVEKRQKHKKDRQISTIQRSFRVCARRSGETRTRGLDIPNVAPYQLGYTPKHPLLYPKTAGLSSDSAKFSRGAGRARELQSRRRVRRKCPCAHTAAERCRRLFQRSRPAFASYEISSSLFFEFTCRARRRTQRMYFSNSK